MRAAAKRKTANKYVSKIQARTARKEHVTSHPMPRSDLEDLFQGGQEESDE